MQNIVIDFWDPHLGGWFFCGSMESFGLERREMMKDI